MLPVMLAHLWNWFNELNEERTGNGFGPNPLSSGQILDWQELTGNKVEPWELRALRELDRIYLVSQLKKGGHDD